MWCVGVLFFDPLDDEVDLLEVLDELLATNSFASDADKTITCLPSADRGVAVPMSGS